MKPIIFVGPTISVEEARPLLDADYRGPVALGDVWRAVRDAPPAIGIIDGYFHSIPAVWHKELLWALDQGITLFGSSSMGALRAAELDRFGMIGVGAIYQAFRQGELEDDDEVALVHTDATRNFRPLSEAMVNIRATLAQALARGIISEGTRRQLEAIAKAHFYPERVWPLIIRRGNLAGLPTTELMALEGWLPHQRIDRKRDDAVALIQAISEHLAQAPNLPSVPFQFEDTLLWQAMIRQEQARDDRLVLEELKLEPLLFAKLGAAQHGRIGEPHTAQLLLQQLWVLGAYERLAARAWRKQRLDLRAQTPATLGLDPESLLHWLFAQRLGGWPSDLTDFLRARDWKSEELLLTIALREYLYVQATAASHPTSPAGGRGLPRAASGEARRAQPSAKKPT